MAQQNTMMELLLNRIYEEMKQANVNRFYAEELIDKQITKNTCFNVLIVIISTLGALSAIFKDYFIAASLSALVAACTTLNQFFPIFFLDTKEVAQLTRLQTDYTVYFTRLSDLFCLAFKDKLTDVKVQQRFNKLVEDNASKETEIGRMFGKINKKIEEKSTKKSDKLLDSIYNK